MSEGDRYARGMEHLVGVVQELSLARSLDEVMAIARSAARRLTGADGATFVLRDGDMCHYADEDAISPLWKGSRFPMSTCISGWAMLNRRPAVIEDIYADDRIPHDAYRPTFVKSLAMVPIRTIDPLGAIGNYWAERRLPTDVEVRLLQALADSTAVAMENVRVYGELEDRVRERTVQLEEANAALGRAMQSLREFVAVAAHDLRSPLASIGMAAQLLGDEARPEERQRCLEIIERQLGNLGRLTDDLAVLSRIDAGQLEVRPQVVPLRELVERVTEETAAAGLVRLQAVDGLRVRADPSHLHRILVNLFTNAMKYGRPPIEVDAVPTSTYVDLLVRDAGPGVDDAFVGRLFHRFARAEASQGLDGTGLGLSIVKELAVANGGDAFYRRAEPLGACFGVRLPAA